MPILTAAEIGAIVANEYGWSELSDGNWVKLGDGVTLGNGVKLGNWVTLGNEVTLGNWVTLGNEVKLGSTPCHVSRIRPVRLEPRRSVRHRK